MIDAGTLIIAHLVGDYLWQNDWQAQNKQARPWPCVVHASLYTFAFVLLTWSAWPAWAYAVIGGTHLVIDHFARA